ncbi:MAG: hypothetical protein EOP06_25405 [Proteobacteria bacterium]|nr:MAG: hypothetical protein EOP06_25405 [Pseudomonadota bacterium]
MAGAGIAKPRRMFVVQHPGPVRNVPQSQIIQDATVLKIAKPDVMKYIALLQFIQANIRLLQNYRFLCESFLPFDTSMQNLLAYLQEAEPSLYLKWNANKTDLEKAAKHLEDLGRLGVQFAHPGHSHYPVSFLQMPGAPLLFSFRGHPAWLKRPGIAVVGSRDSSRLSHLWMEEFFADFLKREKAATGLWCSMFLKG